MEECRSQEALVAKDRFTERRSTYGIGRQMDNDVASLTIDDRQTVHTQLGQIKNSKSVETAINSGREAFRSNIETEKLVMS